MGSDPVFQMADRILPVSDDLQAAYDGLPHPAVVLGRDRHVRYMNPPARRITGPHAEGVGATADASGAWAAVLGSPDSRAAQALETVVTGRATRIDVPHLMWAGMEYRVRIWRARDGLVHLFLLPLETEDRRLARADAAMQALVRDFPHGVCYVFDDRLRYLAAHGREVERRPDGVATVVGATLEQVWPDEVVGQLAAPYLRALSGAEADFVVRMDGRVYRHWTTGASNVDGHGPCGIAMVWDVTDRVANEASLGVIRDSIEALPMGVTVGSVGRDVRIVYANRGFTDLSGYDLGEVLGREFTFLFGDGGARDRIASAIRDDRGAQEVLLAYRADGSGFWDRVTVSPIQASADGTPRFVAVHEDVSEHRRIGEELQTRRRLGALGELAGGVAHDMRNVLAGAGLELELIIERSDLAAPVRDDLRGVLCRLRQGKATTDRLLTFARDHTIERGPLELSEFIETRIELLKAVLRESIAVRFDPPPSPAWILGNEGQIKQAIVNIATNAEHAMPDGGLLEFVLRSGLSSSALGAEVPSEMDDEPDSWAVIHIRDHGVGMTEEVARRAFEPFFTTRLEKGGTGLGLASVFGVVRDLNGVCWIESQEGVGTTVSLAFPETDARPRESAQEQEQVEERRYEGLRVLIAEDDPAIRRACSRYLQRRGADVEDVPDGAAGRDALRSPGARYNLLITDAVMPELSGPELIDEARRLDREIACLLVSGYTAGELPGRLDSVRFLEKPFSMDSLCRAIDEALRQPGRDPVQPNSV